MARKASGGRPRGEVRLALAVAAAELTRENGGATWREMAIRACVGFAAARDTTRNMARAGELQVLEYRCVIGTNRRAVIFAPGQPVESASDAEVSLAVVLGAWRSSTTCNSE